MKKTLLSLLFLAFALTASSQEFNEENYYKGIESYQDLRLSSEQIAKIKKLKREKGPKFAAIGKDRSLTGYEKGQKKRELAQKYRNEIQSILTQDQVSIWEKKHSKLSADNSMKDIISDSFDDSLDALEAKYKAEKKAIENNYLLSKEERKTKEKALKSAYKAEKEKLKARKKAAKNKF